MPPRFSALALALVVSPGLGCAQEERVAPDRGQVTREAPVVATPVRRDLPADVEPELPPEEARALVRKRLREGRKHAHAGRQAEALEAFERGLEVDPTNVTLLAEAGWVAFKAEELERARSLTVQANRYAREPERKGMVLYNLGRIAEASGDREAATGFYRASLRHRPHDAVAGRLASLEPVGPEKGAGPTSWRVLAKDLASLQAVCDAAVEARCADYQLEGTCDCAPVLVTPDGAAPGGNAGLVSLSTEQGNTEVWFVVLRADGGWALFEETAWAFTPGIFGITETLERTRVESTSLLPGGGDELLVAFDKTRHDVDLGVDEVEEEHEVVVQVCSLDGGQPRCTAPIVESYEYERRREGGDAPAGDSELPIVRKYQATVSFGGDGTVTTRVLEATEGQATGPRAPGTRNLGALLGAR